MFYIEQACPVCRSGAIGIRKCSDGHTLVLMCNECDAVWVEPSSVHADNARFPTYPDFKLPGVDCSVTSPGSDWANHDEIQAAHWERFVGGEGDP
jgi:hypothetical protein